jgi:hypothetical protein
MEKIILLVLLAFVSTEITYAQKINISIADSKGQPLPYTSVLLRQIKDSSLVKGELSDASGICNFDKISDGRYFIQASLMGYTTTSTPVFSVDADHKNIKLSKLVLQQASKNLQGVTVSAQKPFIERRDGATILNVESSVAASGGTALDILQRAPGVQVDQDDNVLLKGKKGVTIMLDGKLTYLSGEQLANLLKSMPAETISQIEIITSPSAKYDAAGNSGIINIKTKKGVITGINGSVTAGIGAGRYPIYNIGTNLNWRTEKFNLFGNYDYNNRRFFNDRKFIRNISGDIPQTFTSDIFARRKFTSSSFKAGLDYFITPKHTVGVLVNGFQNAFYSNLWNKTSITGTGEKLDSALQTYTNNNDRFRNTTVNVNYKGQLDTIGTEISMDADLAKFHYHRNVHLNDSMYHPEDPSNYDPHAIRNNTFTDITIKSIKADLVLPFNKTLKLEAGVKGSFVTTNNVLLYDSLRLGKYEPALSQSNQFIYKENVLAAYATIKKSFKGTDVQFGLRMEQTNSDGESVTLQSRVKRSYLDFFPSMSADHTFNESHKMGISYSRRINRPDYDNLNPFVYFLDKYTYGKGNPYLNPEYTNTAELSYTFKQKYIATLGYNVTNHVILEYLDQDEVTKVTTSYEKNFERSNGYYATIILPLDPTKWWNITNNINLNYNKYHIKDTSINLASSIVAFNYQSTHTFTLPDNWKLELNGYYNSPFVWGIFKGRSNFNIGAGVQKSLFNKRATFKLNVSDIFYGEQFRGTAKYNGLDISIHNRWQSRRANFSVTWNFGNSAVKGARERQTGTSDEQRRTGN